ncbi:MAG: flagellar biosynthesis regulator FlaF [Alphaproteobacteria bacterium]|nr:flagellar biosynthesis regulator FlaF [Alphaproteobacteria bacterium]
MDHSQSYSQVQVSGLKQTELESRALVRTAGALNYLKEHWEEQQGELSEVLEKNRKLWAILASAMKEEDCPQPLEIKRNILSLAVFVFQRTVDILANPEPKKLDVLININMNLAKGLSGDGVENK